MNSAIRRRRIGVAAVLSTAAVAVAGTTAAANPTDNNRAGSNATKTGLYQDYLTGASVQMAGEDQCSKPVAQRTGAWFCPQTDKPAAKAKPASTGFCNFSGCYTEYDNHHIDFQSDTDYWGYGSWTAGTVSFKTEWSLDGQTAITAKPVILTTSINVTNVHFTGDLFNPPPNKIGTEIPGKYFPASAGNSNGTISWPLPDGGYSAWDSDNYNRTCVIEASWALPDYPGYWYVYVKSPIASNGNGRNTPPFGAFYFRGADQLPATPFVGNYRR